MKEQKFDWDVFVFSIFLMIFAGAINIGMFLLIFRPDDLWFALFVAGNFSAMVGIIFTLALYSLPKKNETPKKKS